MEEPLELPGPGELDDELALLQDVELSEQERAQMQEDLNVGRARLMLGGPEAERDLAARIFEDEE